MDPIAIILTIAACVGGLLLLVFAAWATAAAILFSKAKKSLLL